MGLATEIFMLVGGLYALATAKVPSFLVGGGKYEVEGTPARVIGAVLILPLPAAFLAESVLGYLLGQEGTRYAFWLEIALVDLNSRLLGEFADQASGEIDPAPVDVVAVGRAAGKIDAARLRMLPAHLAGEKGPVARAQRRRGKAVEDAPVRLSDTRPEITPPFLSEKSTPSATCGCTRSTGVPEVTTHPPVHSSPLKIWSM